MRCIWKEEYNCHDQRYSDCGLAYVGLFVHHLAGVCGYWCLRFCYRLNKLIKHIYWRDLVREQLLLPQTIAILYIFLLDSEPSIRGVLLAGCGIATTTGIFLVYLLGSLYTWRQVAMICAIFPALNILIALFVCILCK